MTLLLNEKKEMSNEFNKYFCNVTKRLDCLMPPNTVSPTSYVDCNTPSFLAPTSTNEFKLVLLELKKLLMA